MERTEYIKFLNWVDKHTYFFEDKDVTINQVVNEYLNIKRHSKKYLNSPIVKLKPEFKFFIGNIIKYSSKSDYYTAARLGSKGKIKFKSRSMGMNTYFIEFKNGSEWLFENQIKLWK